MKGNKFDAAFKQEAIKKVLEEGKIVSIVAEELVIHIKTMYRWRDESNKMVTMIFPVKAS